MFETKTDFLVRGALDGHATRHRVLVNNIANVDTPGFQPSDVPFEEELRAAGELFGRGAARPRFTPTEVATPAEQTRADGNGVQIDDQTMRLAENTLGYEALTQAARMRNELLRSIVTEGRK